MDETNQNQPPVAKSQGLAIPIAIVLGFGMIAAAIFFSGNVAEPTEKTTVTDKNRVENNTIEKSGTINPVTDADHIRGNPNAPILIVEYSDFDCPFCKLFHETMNRIMDEYGPGGQVAWVYRQFPLDSLHPSAPHIAEASECVAAIGGNESFWTFADLVFSERGQNQPTNIARLAEFAETAGVSIADYQACMEAGEMKALVQADFENALAIGARGTPYSVLIVGNQQFVLNGARPYDEVKSSIDSLIRQMGGQEETEEADE